MGFLPVGFLPVILMGAYHCIDTLKIEGQTTTIKKNPSQNFMN